MSPTPPHAPSRTIRFLHAIDRLYSRGFHRVDVTGVQRVPRAGAGVIVANHISSLDPVLIQSTIARPVVWMMAAEYFALPYLGKVFELIDVIPVGRDGRDSSALRRALRALSDGRLLGIFPEGKIAKTRDLNSFETGAALIAVRGGAPVYPVRIEGTPRGGTMAGVFARPQHVRLHFAEPLTLPNDRTAAALQSATTAMQNAVATAFRRSNAV